jgi:sulfite dehydrogenase
MVPVPGKARVDPASGRTLLPNEAFFVRGQVAGIPTRVDTGSLDLQIDRHVQRSLALSLDDLRRRFEPVSVIAIAQRSGKSRSLFESLVQGGQWRHGAMGNALWSAVRLHDLLEAAGIRAGAIDVNSLRFAQPWRRGCPP